MSRRDLIKDRWGWAAGSVIDSRHVLTAAHCVVEELYVGPKRTRILKECCREDIAVYFNNEIVMPGGTKVSECRTNNDIEWIKKYPCYETSFNDNSIGFLYDVALIRFRHDISVPSIRVVSPSDFERIQDDQCATLHGFGQDAFALRQLDGTISKNKCDADFFNETTLANNAASDHGDSGGPLVVEIPNGRIQIGVHSQGPKRKGADQGYGVCARIARPDVHRWMDRVTTR